MVAGLAGDLSALGEDAERVWAVESLSVPSWGGGIGGDMCVLIFDRPGVPICGVIRATIDPPKAHHRGYLLY